MAQAVYDEHPLEQYLRDEAGEVQELMPGASAEFPPLDDECEAPDGEYADTLTPLQGFVLELIEVISNLVQQLNASSLPSSPFVERFKYHVISSSLLADSVAPSSTRLSASPPTLPGNLADDQQSIGGDSNSSRPSFATVLASSEYPGWYVSGGIALLALLLSIEAYALILLVCVATAAVLTMNQDSPGRPDFAATLDVLDALVSAGNMWDSAVSEALQAIERDEQRMATSASSPSAAPTSPLRVALNSSMHSTQTQCDNVRQLFVALTCPTELAPLAEMYAPSSPSRPPFAELPNADRPLSLPTRKRTSSLTSMPTPSMKRSTWNGSYAALARAGSPTMQVLTHRQKRRSDLSSLLQVSAGSPVKSRSAPGTPTTPALDGVREEEPEPDVADSPSASMSSFGSAALDLRRKRQSMGLQSLGMSSARSSPSLGSRHPLSLMSLTSSVHEALAARRYSCAHLLALRFGDDDDELYWEDVRSVMSLLTGTLADVTARLAEAFEEVDTQKLRDEVPTPTPWDAESSFGADSRRSSLNLDHLKNRRTSLNADGSRRSSAGELRNRRSSMLRHAMNNFAPTPGPLTRFAAHVHTISSALDDAREELERTVAALKEDDASPRTQDAEQKQHPALAAYERLRRELGLALRECERGRDRLLDAVAPVPPPGVEDDSEELPSLSHDLSDDSDKPEPMDEDNDPYGGIAALEPDGEYVGAAPDFRDDVATTLLASSRLPPPGVEQVFEDDAGSALLRLRERPKLSRDERIKAARAAREARAEEPPRRGFGPGGEVVQELKDVIWKVGERRRRLTLDTKPPLSQSAQSPLDTPSPEFEAAQTPPRMRYEDSARMSIVLEDLPRISLEMPTTRRSQFLPTLHEDSPVIPRGDLPRLPAFEEFGYGV